MQTPCGSGGGRQTAMRVAVVAAVLLAVVDVLSASDNDHNPRRRHRLKEVEIDLGSPAFDSDVQSSSSLSR